MPVQYGVFFNPIKRAMTGSVRHFSANSGPNHSGTNYVDRIFVPLIMASSASIVSYALYIMVTDQFLRARLLKERAEAKNLSGKMEEEQTKRLQHNTAKQTVENRLDDVSLDKDKKYSGNCERNTPSSHSPGR